MNSCDLIKEATLSLETWGQEVMLRRLKVEVMAQLPPKRRQVVRLPAPKQADWPPSEMSVQDVKGVFLTGGCHLAICPSRLSECLHFDLKTHKRAGSASYSGLAVMDVLIENPSSRGLSAPLDQCQSKRTLCSSSASRVCNGFTAKQELLGWRLSCPLPLLLVVIPL